jgi:PST family polysaccharide transporter
MTQPPPDPPSPGGPATQSPLGDNVPEVRPDTSDDTDGGVAHPDADAEHNPSLEDLGGRLRQGAKFAAVALVFTQLISLGQTVVVARLLTPLEIGTFTLGTLFANFLTTVADGGMRAALIQREHDIEDAANTAFWVSLVTGTAMSLAALAVAPLLALYLDDQLVGLICAATCGTLLVHALLNVPEALMQRRFNFKRRLIVDPTTATTYAVVAVTAILLGFGVWGMVIGLYASQLATLIACWMLAKWRPGKGTFTFRIWREMAGYSAPLILSGIVENARDAIQSALVGRQLDVASAGQYRYGRRIGILPGQAIIQVASYVLFPAFARIAADVTRFKDGMLRSLRMLWVATTPLAAVLVALGQPLIVVLLGEQWRPAGLFVAAMAGYGPGIAMSAIGAEAIKGAGASTRINWLTGITLVVGIGGLLLLIPYGLVGVGLAASIEGIVSGLASLAFARDLAGITVRDLARLLIPPLTSAAVAGTAVGLLEHFLVRADDRPVALGLVFLGLEGALLLVIFVGVLYLQVPDAVRELRDGLRRRAGGRAEQGQTEFGDEAPEASWPSRHEAYLDAPTVALSFSALDAPTVRVYEPFRRAPSQVRARRAPPPTPPVAYPRPGALVPSSEAVAPLASGPLEDHTGRVARFERYGLDAPTTAIPAVRDGAAPAPELEDGASGHQEHTSRRSSRPTLVRLTRRRDGRGRRDPEDGSDPFPREE